MGDVSIILTKLERIMEAGKRTYNRTEEDREEGSKESKETVIWVC
jgi:hypothetical protein